MPRTNQPADPEVTPDELVRLAEMLGFDLAEKDLAALSKQLHTLDELEQAALQDFPPILKMDADWHD